MDTQTIDQGFQKIWALFEETTRKFQETDRKFQETDRKFQETDRKFQETDRKFQETAYRFQETDRKFQETDRKFQETAYRFQETDRKFQETDRKFQETAYRFQETDIKFQESAEQLRRIEDMFISRWGRFMEVLVNSGALSALREYGVSVDYSAKNVSEQKTNGLGRGMEIDVLCWGKEIVVPIEVKTTLKIEDVTDHEDRLRRFTECFPRFAGMTLYGGIAALQFDEESDKYAYRRGFYVLTLVGEKIVRVMNDRKFRPKEWSETKRPDS